MYTKKVMEYFLNPKNMGRIDSPDGMGKAGNPVCGDVMYIYIKVKNDTITDIKFETFGCAAAIATSSIVTELAKGKTLEEAMQIDNKKVSQELGGLPPQKEHCSNLAADALKEAIYNYLKKTKQQIPEELEKEHQRIQKMNESIKH